MERPTPFEEFCEEAWEKTIATMKTTTVNDILRHDPIAVAVEYLNHVIVIKGITSKTVAGDAEELLEFAARGVTHSKAQCDTLIARLATHGAVRHFGRIHRLLGRHPEIRYSPMRLDGMTVRQRYYRPSEQSDVPAISSYEQGVLYKGFTYGWHDLVPMEWVQFLAQLHLVLSGNPLSNLYLSERPVAYAGRICTKELYWEIHNQTILDELAQH